MTGDFGLSDAQAKELQELKDKSQEVVVLTATQLKKCEDIQKKKEIGKATEKQLLEMKELRAKEGTPKGLTEKQEERLQDLIYKEKNPELSQTTKTYMNEIFIEQVYLRKREITSKFLEKGIKVEDESLRLLSRYTGEEHVKNVEKFENGLIKGEPDFIGEKIKDTKSSWDIWTFFNSKMTPDYYGQLQGYMWLTGIQEAELVYCLVDTPLHLIIDEQKKLAWRTGVIDPENDPDYQMACEEIEKNFTFPDIPEEKRLRIYEIGFDQDWINELEVRIHACRDYLNNITEEVLQS